MLKYKCKRCQKAVQESLRWKVLIMNTYTSCSYYNTHLFREVGIKLTQRVRKTKEGFLRIDVEKKIVAWP